MQNPPSYQELVRFELKLIGTIVRSFEHELRGCATDLERRETAKKFDAQFGGRHDYRIWRPRCTEFRRRSQAVAIPPPETPSLSSAQSLSQLASVLSAAPLEEAWGVIGLVAWKALPETDLVYVPELVDAIHAQRTLARCPVNCAIARSVASARVIRGISRLDRFPKTYRALVQRHIALLDDQLSIIDGSFQIGNSLRYEASRTEQEIERLRIIPEDPVSTSLRSFASSLLDCQRLSRDYALSSGTDGTSRQEAAAVFRLVYAAWRTRRLLRLDYRKLADESDTDLATFERIHENLYAFEMSALQSAAHAAVLAHEFIAAGGFWWTYSTLFAKKPPRHGLLPTWSHRRVREVGLGVDDAYIGPSNDRTTPRSVIFETILAQHRAAHPDIWAPVDAEVAVSGRNGETERTLRNLAEAYDKKRRPADQQVIESLLKIALSVDFIRTTVDMLRRLDNPAPYLVPIAKRVAECTRTNRLALSGRRLGEWMLTLRERWDVCAGDPLADEDRFALHEVLLGRHATIRGTLRPRAAELLLNRVFNADVLIPPNYFDVIEQQEDAFKPGPDLIPPRDLRGFISRHQSYRLGAPLVVSLVTLASGTSVVTQGLRTGLLGSFRPDLKLAGEFETLIRQRNYWFRWRRGNTSSHVPWGEGAFLSLRDEIVALARENGARWIMLAIEPRLSALPWQHLFSHSQGFSRLTSEPLLVTIVPNMGWGPLLDRNPFRGMPVLRELVCQSNDPVIEKARSVLNALKKNHPIPPFNLGVVLGHGYWPERAGRLPEIVISNKKLEAEDWLEVANCQIIVLHSCWSGTAAEATQWAEGALVVHLLGPSRAVVAPVGEVPVMAMEAMHREFVGGVANETLGERYLRALTREPSVSLYTIFGLGSEMPFAV
jgi:hypothetical protein